MGAAARPSLKSFSFPGEPRLLANIFTLEGVMGAFSSFPWDITEKPSTLLSSVIAIVDSDPVFLVFCLGNLSRVDSAFGLDFGADTGGTVAPPSEVVSPVGATANGSSNELSKPPPPKPSSKVASNWTPSIVDCRQNQNKEDDLLLQLQSVSGGRFGLWAFAISISGRRPVICSLK
jgi:hypothetical protein